MTSIPVNRPKLYKETMTMVKQCIQSGWISGEGPYVEQFESEFSKYVGVKYGTTTNSGTTALHLALLTLGIGKGDEVILPATTIASCFFAIWYVGAKAVPVDVDIHTYTINPMLIAKHITKKTKAIMPVHLYGHPSDMDPIMALAKKHHLFVIEDAAEAHGATYKGKQVGSFGDISIFSFYANKIVTCGEGGIIVTNNKTYYERAKSLKNLSHTKHKRFIHDKIGYRYQMTNMQAAIGLVSLSHIQESINYKRNMATIYNDGLQSLPGIIKPFESHSAQSVYWMYAIRIDPKVFGISRDEVMKRLQQKSIQTRSFFYAPNTAYKKIRLFSHIHTPVADLIETQGIYLPSGLGNTKKEFLLTIQQLKKIYKT